MGRRSAATLFSPLLFQMLTFIMLARLCALCPSAVLQRLERLVEPLRATCSTKVRLGRGGEGLWGVLPQSSPLPTLLQRENHLPVSVPAGTPAPCLF